MKIKKNMQDHIDVLNRELKSFATRNPAVIFNDVVNTDEDYTQGSLKFDSFTVLFRCHDGGSGYSFMEIPLFEEDGSAPMGCIEATYEALFKFDFSEIPFSIYDIHNAVNDQNFRTLCFHNIITEENAVDAAGEILDFIEKNEYQINKIGSDKNLQKLLLDNYYYDEKIFDKEFDINKFNDDIETNAEMHEVFMSLTLTIQDGVYKFLLTGNNKLLVKQFTKAEKKNNLILFEKRYEKYLYDNNFAKPNNNTGTKLKQKRKNTKLTKLYSGLVLVSGMVCSIFLSELISDFIIKTYHPDSLFLTSVGNQAFNLTFIFGIILIFFSFAYKLPFGFLKNKIERIFKKEYDKIILIIGLVLTIVGIGSFFNTYKNHSMVIKDNTLYIENQATPEDYNIEFIYIKGQEYEDFDGNIIYEDDIESRQLLYVLDNDYENYIHCEIGIVSNEVLTSLRKADCKLSTYRTIEDFASKNGFEITEE